MAKKALIMVDLQHDFCEGGNLAVAGGKEVVLLANQLQPYFECIVATRDWHPAEHKSFAVNQPEHSEGEVIMLNGVPQVLWPKHCVQGTKGAELHKLLDTSHVHQIIHKGTDIYLDSYSAFFDNEHLRETGLADYLHSQEVTDVYLLGLATDYCVKYSCLDTLQLGFKVYVIEDACRAVELKAGDGESALIEMREAGAIIIHSSDIMKTTS